MTYITQAATQIWAFINGVNVTVAVITALTCLGLHLWWRKDKTIQPPINDEQPTITNEQYKDAQRLANIGHWDHVIGSNRLVWSEEVYRIFGIGNEDFAGTLEDFYELIHPDDRDDVRNTYTQSLQDGRDYEITHRIICNDGETAYVRERCHTYYDTAGTAVRSLGTIQDITAQKTAENDLRRAKYEAEAATRTKNAFLATMSHEIRTPLNGILGMLQLLSTTQLDTEQGDYVNLAITSSKRLSDLLSDILEISKLETEKVQLQQDRFDIHATVTGVMDIFTKEAERKGLDFSLSLGEHLPTNVMGDEARLRHILFNVVGNAVKFTKQGQINVEVDRLTSSEETVHVLFSVADTGPGIPDDMLGLVLEPFTQTEDVMVREHGGAGLGLSIVKRLTKLMGGTMAISTEESQGTEFCLCLPLRNVPVDYRCPVINIHPERQLKECKVLLVEDDAVNQLALSKLLQKQGLHVDIADNGLEALEKIRSNDHHIIFMDIQMPLMDGMATTRAVRSGQAGSGKSNIPIVALTAYAMIGDRKRFMQAGMNDYLSKPVTMDRLQAVLKREIGQVSQ